MPGAAPQTASNSASIPQGGFVNDLNATAGDGTLLQGGVTVNAPGTIPGGIFNNNLSATAIASGSVNQSAPITQIITGGENVEVVTDPPNPPPNEQPPIQDPPVVVVDPPVTQPPVVVVPPVQQPPVVPVVDPPVVPPINTVPVVNPPVVPPINTVPVVNPPTTPPVNTVPVVNPPTTPPATTPPTNQPPVQTPPTTTPPPPVTPPPTPPTFSDVAGYVNKQGKVTARPALPATVADPGAIAWAPSKLEQIKMADGSVKTEIVYKDVSGQIVGNWRGTEAQQLGGALAPAIDPNWFISSDGKWRDKTKQFSGAYTEAELKTITASGGVLGGMPAAQARPLTEAEKAAQRVAQSEAWMAEAMKPQTTTATNQAPLKSGNAGVPLTTATGGNASMVAGSKPSAPQYYTQAVTGTTPSGAPPTATDAWTQNATGTPAFLRTPGWQPTTTSAGNYGTSAIPQDVVLALSRFENSQNSSTPYADKTKDLNLLYQYVNAVPPGVDNMMRDWMEQRDAAVQQYAGQQYNEQINTGYMGGPQAWTGAYQSFEVDRNLGQIKLPDGSQLTNMLMAWESMGVKPNPALLEYAMNRDYLMWNLSVGPDGKTGGEFYQTSITASGSPEGMGGMGTGSFFTPTQAAYDSVQVAAGTNGVPLWGTSGSGVTSNPNDGFFYGGNGVPGWGAPGGATIDPNTGKPTGLTLNQPGPMTGSGQINTPDVVSKTTQAEIVGPTAKGIMDGSLTAPAGGPLTPYYDPSYDGVPQGGAQDVGGSWSIGQDGTPFFTPDNATPQPWFTRPTDGFIYNPNNGTWSPPPGYEGGNTQFGLPGSTTSNGSEYMDTQGPVYYGADAQSGMGLVAPASTNDVFSQDFIPAVNNGDTMPSLFDGMTAGQAGSTTYSTDVGASPIFIPTPPKTTTRTRRKR